MLSVAIARALAEGRDILLASRVLRPFSGDSGLRVCFPSPIYRLVPVDDGIRLGLGSVVVRHCVPRRVASRW